MSYSYLCRQKWHQRSLKAFMLLAVLFVPNLMGCTTISKKNPRCWRYAVIPPEHLDEKVAHAIRQLWMKKVEPDLEGCHKFVTGPDVDSAFALADLTHKDTPARVELNEDRMDFVRKKTRATHLVILRYKIQRQTITIRPQILGPLPDADQIKTSISDLQKIKLSPSSSIVKLNKQWFGYGFSLVPNSASIAFAGSKSVHNERVSTGEIIEKNPNSNSSLSGFSVLSLSSVTPPYRLATFDFMQRAYAGYSFEYYDNSFKYERSEDVALNAEPTLIDYRLRLWHFAPTGNVEISAGTILGTTFLSIGVGPGFYSYEDNFEKKTGVVLFIPFKFGHRVFVTERVFLSLVVGLTWPTATIVKNEIFKSSSSGYAQLNLGFFFPEAASFLRRAF